MWYMIRHGQTLENKLSIQQGQIDTLLSLKGIVQAQSIGYRLLDFNENFEEYEFISSPLARTRHTLQIIIEILNISNAKINNISNICKFLACKVIFQDIISSFHTLCIDSKLSYIEFQ